MKKLAFVAAALVLVAILGVNLFPGPVYRAAMGGERTLAGLETRSMDVDGFHFSYTDSDNGAPLVLLHGFTADKDHWTRVARHLTGTFRVIAPDLPGFGDSTRDPALDYSIASQADRLQIFVDQLELKQFHLGGSSMGGGVAAMFAARHPDRVLSLWLLAPAGVVTDQLSDMERILFSGAPHPLIPGNRQQLDDTLDFVFVKQPFLPGPLRRHLTEVAIDRKALRMQIFDDLLDDSGAGLRYPLNELVDGMSVPTLIVWGERDRVLHPDGAETLAGLMGNATVELLPQTGHLPMLENPALAAEGFLRFQSQLQAD